MSSFLQKINNDGLVMPNIIRIIMTNDYIVTILITNDDLNGFTKIEVRWGHSL